MWWMFLLYVVLPVTLLGIAGFALWRARRREAPAAPPALARNGIISQEWELVRNSHCVPTRCPRTIGTPPRPRKDSHCETCAAQFLDGYWRRLLQEPGEGNRPPQPRRRPAETRHPDPQPLITLSSGVPEPLLLQDSAAAPGRRGGQWWPRAFFIAGPAVVVAGGVLVVLSPWAGAGYGVAGLGVACILLGAARGAA